MSLGRWTNKESSMTNGGESAAAMPTGRVCGVDMVERGICSEVRHNFGGADEAAAQQAATRLRESVPSRHRVNVAPVVPGEDT